MLNCIAVFCLLLSSQVEITNPYYEIPEWKIWANEAGNDTASIGLTAPEKRLFPKLEDSHLEFETKPSQPRAAGWWDDVYVSLDNFHSSIRTSWQGEGQRKIQLRGQFPIIKRGYFTFEVAGNKYRSAESKILKQLGANLTSQSTNGVGHDVANNGLQSLVIEREFYFASMLRAAPAHISFRELNEESTVDEFQSLFPSIYNSIGSSSSETWALTKMLIAGAHLSRDLKTQLKENGIYPATLLYIWKAGLPYDVPYEHEMRHKVAYLSDGEDRENRGKLQADSYLDAHKYNDALHLKNMCALAQQLDNAPPIAILGPVKNEGGELIYSLKTAALVHQKMEDVTLSFSMHDSYDIDGEAVTIKPVVISGNPSVTITRNGNEFVIKVPYDSNLPRGRTSIGLFPNSSSAGGNPAIVTVFNDKEDRNQRPTIELADRFVVAPGRVLQKTLAANDPEGFAVSFYKRADHVGKIEDNRFIWRCPPDQKEGTYPVTFIASDRSSGSSLTSTTVPVEVLTVLARLKAEPTSGLAPLDVDFSSKGSASVYKEPLTYSWTIDGIEQSVKSGFSKNFEKPGFYQVGFKAKAGGSENSRSVLIHARHNWKIAVDQGWAASGISTEIWRKNDPDLKVSTVGRGENLRMQVSPTAPDQWIELLKQIKPPLYLEFEFDRAHHINGVGLEVFGAVFGRGVVANENGKPKKYAKDISFTQLDPKTGSLNELLIADFPKTPSGSATIRMYVTADEDSESCLRFTGYLEVNKQSHFFSICGQPKINNRIGILAGVKGTQVVRRFQIWSPGN